jgi:hypothetical protein
VERAKGCAALLQGPGLVIEDHFDHALELRPIKEVAVKLAALAKARDAK